VKADKEGNFETERGLLMRMQGDEEDVNLENDFSRAVGSIFPCRANSFTPGGSRDGSTAAKYLGVVSRQSLETETKKKKRLT